MSKKRLNKNLVLLLSAFVALCMVVLAVLMIRQLQSADPARFVELAEAAKSDGNYKQAALLYLKAWERSGDAIHLVRRGEALLDNGDLGAGSRVLQEAALAQPDLREVHVQLINLQLELARLYRGVDQWQNLEQAAEQYLSVDTEKSPEDLAFAHHAHGLALVNLGNQDESLPDKGLAELEQAHELEPANVDYAIDLATRYVLRDRLDDAEALLKGVIARYPEPGPDASQARLGYARFLTSQGRLDEAEPEFVEAIRFAGDDPDSLVDAKSGYAVHLSQRWARAVRSGEKAKADEFFKRAETALREAIEIDPDAFEPPLQLSLLYKLAGRYDDVLAVCEARLSHGFSRKGTEGPRNQYNVFGLSLRACEACVDKALTKSDLKERGELLARAEQYLADARGEFPNHPRAFYQEGRIRLAEGHDRAALEAFRAADERYKSFDRIDWENKIALARLHLKLAEPGAALAVLNGVIEEARAQRASDTAFWLLYAQAQFQTGNLDEARIWANRILAVNPDSATARRIKAAIDEHQADPAAAAEVLASGPMSCLLRAKQRTLDGDDEGALAVIMECLDKDPGNLLLVRAAAGELLSRNRASDARAVVTRAIRIDPDSRQLKELDIAVRDDLTPGQRDQAVLDLIATEQDAYRRALDLLAFHVRAGHTAEALAAIDEAERLYLEKSTPTAQRAAIGQYRALLTEKLRLAALAGDDKAMAEARDAAIRYNVDGAGGQTLVGLYHIHRQEWEAAVTALKAALQVQGTDARTLAHLGQCLIMLGRNEEAQVQLQRAVDINPNDPIAHRALGSLAQERGDMEELERHLAVCERLIPNDPWVVSHLLDRDEDKDPVAAIAKREAALAANPDDIYNLLRLARLCETSGDRAKADEYFQKLLELRPDQRSVVFAVALHYQRTDRADEGLAVIRRYIDTRTTDDDRANGSILIASYYLNEDKPDLAEATLLEAVDKHETLDLAQSLGEFYLKQDDRAPDALKWYDRAVALAKEGQHPQLPRLMAARIGCLLNRQINDVKGARQSVDELMSLDPDNLPALLLDSEIAARAGDIDAAIRSLTRYLEKVPDNSRVLFQRAQHYVAQGKTAAAIEDLETIKTHDPLALDLAPRLLLAQLHRQSGRRDAWIAELESLRADAPDNPTAIEALVRAYVRTGRFAEADSIVTAQINRHADKPDARWFALRGSISFALHDFDKALADYRRSAELDSLSGNSFAAVLDAHDQAKRFAEGVAYYREHAADVTKTPSILARYALLLARSGDAPAAVETFREAAALAMAESNTAVGEVIHRVLLAFEPEQAVALFEDPPSAPASARANDRILIRLYRRVNRLDDAIRLAGRLLDTADTDAERAQLLEEQGDAFNQGGKADEARQAYEEALKYGDHNWILLNNLAFLLAENLGKFAEARPYAERAVALAETTYTLDTLGWIYVGLGEYTRGIGELNRAIRLDPDAAESYYHLGEAYRRAGRFREAVDILERGAGLVRASESSALRDSIDASLDKAQRRDDSK